MDEIAGSPEEFQVEPMSIDIAGWHGPNAAAKGVLEKHTHTQAPLHPRVHSSAPPSGAAAISAAHVQPRRLAILQVSLWHDKDASHWNTTSGILIFL